MHNEWSGDVEATSQVPNGALRRFAHFGTSRRLGPRAVWNLAPLGTWRSSDLRGSALRAVNPRPLEPLLWSNSVARACKGAELYVAAPDYVDASRVTIRKRRVTVQALSPRPSA